MHSAKASEVSVKFTLTSMDPYVLIALIFAVVEFVTADHTTNIPMVIGPYVDAY
jgi:hypothetical protein